MMNTTFVPPEPASLPAQPGDVPPRGRTVHLRALVAGQARPLPERIAAGRRRGFGRASPSGARSEGRAVTGTELADTLTRYSEKGAEYVNTLKGIMRINELAVADRATLQAAPAILLIDVPGEEEVAKMKSEIAALRATGELDEILAEMGVDFD